MHPVNGTGCASVDIDVNENLQLVDNFCHLGDMMSVDRDDDATVETRILTGWNKFRQLIPVLTNKYISLIVKGRRKAVVCKVVCCMEVRPGKQKGK